jgi:hypothetical protein
VPAPTHFPIWRMHVRAARPFALATALAVSVALPLAAQTDSTLPPAPASQAPASTGVPTPGDASQIPSIPGYNHGNAPLPGATPTPVEGVPPVVATKQTREHPNLAYNPYAGVILNPIRDWMGSPYIPMDSWMYPALLRLYGLGYVDSAFLALRPWTRRSVLHMLELSEDSIRADDNNEALDILDKLEYALRDETSFDNMRTRGLVYGIDAGYVGARIVGGTVLRDSWHLGETFNNDYGRPYSNGFNTYDGVSAITEFGPFSLNVRGEFQHAPTYQGYSFALATQLSQVDQINYCNQNPEMNPNQFGGANCPQATIPQGLLPAQNNFRLLQASVGVHAVGHEISFGKSDAWLGPGLGGAMAWSNNAEDMYAFRINRVEPLYIPFVSRFIGTIRYDFFVGSLQGHTFPRHPYAHSETLALAPTKNFQLSFQRTIVWGGAGHQPVTLHTFLKGFFDSNDTSADEKYSRDDPGARFSTVTFSYRLPFLRKRVMLYTDSTTHDDIFPISAPRRAGWRPGIFISQMPFVPKLDLRVEATYTDYVTSKSNSGQGNYFETIQKQAYTNKGVLMGDWIGREAKGGQAWLTYHLSGNESITFQYLHKKNAKDFIQYGTTQNIFRVDVVKRLTRDMELSAWFQAERWKAPIWMTGQQGSTTGAFQVTWFPGLHTLGR